MSWSRRPLAVLALAGLLAVGATACSGDDDAAPAGTSTPGTIVAPPTTPSTTATPTTTIGPTTTATPPGGPASSLPPNPSTPGAGDACATLSRTLTLSDLLPRDGLSWPDERSRVVTDARLNAQLYSQAQGQLPGNEGQYAGMLGEFSTFVADSTQDADSAAAARAEIDSYPNQGEAAAANAELDRWRGVNCG